MKLLITVPLALLLAVAVQSAPAPKSSSDAKQPAFAPEPAEPAIDPEEAAKNPVLKVRDAANRTKSSNNLKQIAIALHNYHDVFNKMPADIQDKDGKPILSWRVQLLPYIEQEQLYKQLKLDEPWDGPNNLALLEKMPNVFESPRVTVKKKGFTVYQGFNGKDTVFESGKKITFASISDGLSNTIFAVESTAAQPWTKPADLPFDSSKDVPDFGKAFGGRPLVALCDGSVRVLDLKKIKPETLKNAINRRDGNVLGADW